MTSIYVSGPIMAPDLGGQFPPSELVIKRRKDKFNTVSKIIDNDVDFGTFVVNPLDIEACSELTYKPKCDGLETGKHSWQCFLRYDLERLVMCDTIVMLPGWEGSPGANVECRVAQMLGLEILYWCDEHVSAHETPCTKDEKECKGV